MNLHFPFFPKIIIDSPNLSFRDDKLANCFFNNHQSQKSYKVSQQSSNSQGYETKLELLLRETFFPSFERTWIWHFFGALNLLGLAHKKEQGISCWVNMRDVEKGAKVLFSPNLEIQSRMRRVLEISSNYVLSNVEIESKCISLVTTSHSLNCKHQFGL